MARPDLLASIDTPLARLLLKAFRGFEERLLQHLADAGHDDVSASHIHLLRHLDPGGLRMSQLAADAGLSKQAVSQLVRPLIQRDLVALTPDPDDGRAKRVVWTDHGQLVLQAAIRAATEIESDYIDLLGEETYLATRTTLERLIAHHQPEA